MKRLTLLIVATILTFFGTVHCTNNANDSKSGAVWLDPSTGMEFIWIPGGEQQMGLSKPGRESQVPRKQVSGFWMGKTEVTQKQWMTVMGSNPSAFKTSTDDHPVDQVSWDDAQEFIRKLSALSGNVFRLPTEVEWEFAAAGGEALQTWSRPAGNDSGELSMYLYRHTGGPMVRQPGMVCTPVIGGRKNPFGLCDMSGNVWEWCQDSYPGGSPGTYRVLRGGTWGQVGYARHDSRGRNFPNTWINFGFRLVRSSVQQ